MANDPDPSVDPTLDPALDSRLDHLSRRKFLKRAGASAAVSAVLPAAVRADQDIPDRTEDPALIHEEIRFPSGGAEIAGYLAYPKAASKRGGIVVIHEIFGLNKHIRNVASRLADAGYNVLAPDFFSREGSPPVDFTALMPWVNRITDAQIVGDIGAAVETLRRRSDSNHRIGVVGFCWGGYYSMLADAEVHHLNAAVAYYGRIRLPERTPARPHSPLDLAAQMKVPLLGHFGGLDRGITPADAAALKEALAAHHKIAEIYEYEGAGHAFNNDTRESYNPDAAHLAWSRTLAWFQRYVGPAINPGIGDR